MWIYWFLQNKMLLWRKGASILLSSQGNGSQIQIVWYFCQSQTNFRTRRSASLKEIQIRSSATIRNNFSTFQIWLHTCLEFFLPNQTANIQLDLKNSTHGSQLNKFRMKVALAQRDPLPKQSGQIIGYLTPIDPYTEAVLKRRIRTAHNVGK